MAPLQLRSTLCLIIFITPQPPANFLTVEFLLAYKGLKNG
jgi:hypothetical protein